MTTTAAISSQTLESLITKNGWQLCCAVVRNVGNNRNTLFATRIKTVERIINILFLKYIYELNSIRLWDLLEKT